MDKFFKDVRHGARLLTKYPASSAVSVLALTLGIGLTTTMFSIVYGALYRGLPFEQSEQIVYVARTNLPDDEDDTWVPVHDLVDWRAQQRSFEGLAGFYTGTVNVSGTERAERYDGAHMTANAFSLLRVRPVLGRVFQPGEDAPGAEPVVVIGYALWQTRFEGDPNVIGKTIRANGEPMTIIGVMPDKFQFPETQELWLPVRLDPLQTPRGEGRFMAVFGRLRAGKSSEDANAELNAIAQRLEQEYPQTNKNIRAAVRPFTDEYIGDEPRTLLLTMLGAVFFVLLIACTNVANLLLGRAILRSKEVGIRTALGANRWRLMTQFLTEALVLSVVGAIVGLGIAYVGIDIFNRAIVSAQPPFWIQIKLDWIAVGFVLLLTLTTSFFSGTIPALQASRSQVTDVLKDESRGASSFRLGRISRLLVIFEVALSCGLLVAAGLTIKSVVKLRNYDLGFPADNLFTARIGLPELSYRDSTSTLQFFEELDQRLSALPGIADVAIASSLPGVGEGRNTFGVEGMPYQQDRDYPSAARATVSPTYFRTLGVKMLEGRDFSHTDRRGALPVAIVNQSFARRYFGNQSALGRRIRLGASQSTRPWLTIVGIVSDAAAGDLDDDERRPEAMYLPLAQNPQRFMSVIARTRAEPLGVSAPVRETVAAIDADIPTYFVRTLRQSIDEETWFYRVFGVLFMIFGVAALFLAAIGLYAVMAFSVSQRTREVGIRMAIGAQARDVLRLIMRQGFVQVLIGMVIGLAFAAGVSRLLSIILFDVQPRDPTIFAAIVLLLSSTALLACFIPARRATAVDPLEALRAE
jgi:putative ABC transport system permease protein